MCVFDIDVGVKETPADDQSGGDGGASLSRRQSETAEERPATSASAGSVKHDDAQSAAAESEAEISVNTISDVCVVFSMVTVQMQISCSSY